MAGLFENLAIRQMFQIIRQFRTECEPCLVHAQLHNESSRIDSSSSPNEVVQ